jgi:hypothetical protein
MRDSDFFFTKRSLDYATRISQEDMPRPIKFKKINWSVIGVLFALVTKYVKFGDLGGIQFDRKFEANYERKFNIKILQ